MDITALDVTRMNNEREKAILAKKRVVSVQKSSGNGSELPGTPRSADKSAVDGVPATTDLEKNMKQLGVPPSSSPVSRKSSRQKCRQRKKKVIMLVMTIMFGLVT